MNIIKPGKAGTMESNDMYVMVMPNSQGGIELDIESIVMKQFGEEIKRVIMETLESLNVKDALLRVQDKGALNYTIKARVETAVMRAAE